MPLISEAGGDGYAAAAESTAPPPPPPPGKRPLPEPQSEKTTQQSAPLKKPKIEDAVEKIAAMDVDPPPTHEDVAASASPLVSGNAAPPLAPNEPQSNK